MTVVTVVNVILSDDVLQHRRVTTNGFHVFKDNLGLTEAATADDDLTVA